jgi:hypothetical protein
MYQRRYQCAIIIAHDNFFMPSRLAADDFMKGMRLNIAVEHDDHSF